VNVSDHKNLDVLLMEVTTQNDALTPQQRLRLSLSFLIFAWSIEFAAAGVGLTLAISRLGEGAGISALLAALPFFAVAIMELTKIPFTTLIFHTNGGRRIAFSIALALSMLITFETFVMGFDIYQAETARKIKPTLDSVKNIKQRVESASKSIDASKEISQSSSKGDQEYTDQINSINGKWDRIIEAHEKEKASIREKYDGDKDAIRESLKNLRSKIKDQKNQRDKELDELSIQINATVSTKRETAASEVTALQSRIKDIVSISAQEKGQIRKKYSKINSECEESHRKSFLGRDCTKHEVSELQEIATVEKKLNTQKINLEQQLQRAREAVVSVSSTAGEVRKDAIREKYNTLIKKSQNELSEKIAEQGRIRGRISSSDKSRLSDLDKKISIANAQRNLELKEAQRFNNKRRGQVDSAKNDISKITKQSNELREQLSPLCAQLNDAVTDNQVYRLAMQLYGVDDACNLKQEQITMIQWLWFGSLAFVTSALGTTLAFASMAIKYPSTAPSGGGVISGVYVFFQRLSKELYGLIRRLNYTVALLHRRLTRPKIKEIQVEKEIIKEVIKEVPVEKIVIQEVPIEIVKKEIIHVPLFTQDVKAVTKDG
jgi:hypothetical protein